MGTAPSDTPAPGGALHGGACGTNRARGVLWSTQTVLTCPQVPPARATQCWDVSLCLAGCPNMGTTTGVRCWQPPPALLEEAHGLLGPLLSSQGSSCSHSPSQGGFLLPERRKCRGGGGLALPELFLCAGDRSTELPAPCPRPLLCHCPAKWTAEGQHSALEVAGASQALLSSLSTFWVWGKLGWTGTAPWKTPPPPPSPSPSCSRPEGFRGKANH